MFKEELRSLAQVAPEQPGVLFNLNDSIVDEELWEKYDFLGNLTRPVARVGETLVYIAGLIAAKDNLLASQQTYFTEVEDQANPALLLGSFRSNLGLLPTLEITPDAVILQAPLPNLQVWFFGLERNPDQQKYLENYLRIIQSFLPDFQWPRAWERDAQGSGDIVGIFKPISRTWTVTELSKLNPKRLDSLTLRPPDNADFKHYDPIFRMRMETAKVNVIPGDRQSYRQRGSGEVDPLQDKLILTVRNTLEMHFPLEYALWSLSATRLVDFAPYQFWRLIDDKLKLASSTKRSRSSREPLLRYDSAFNGPYNREYYIREHLVKPIKKSNEQNLAITATGSVVWVPEVNDLGNYLLDYARTWDKEDNLIVPPQQIPELCNRIIYVDWITDKFFFTSNDGNPQMLNLLGAQPLDPITIARHFHEPVVPVLERLLPSIRNDRYTVPINPRNLPEDLTWAHLIGAVEYDGTETVFSLKDLRRQCADWRRVLIAINRSFDLSSLSFYDKIALRFYLFLADHYGEDYAKYQERLEAAIAQNTAPIANEGPVITYGLDTNVIAGLLPHQVKVKRLLESRPRNALIGVDAGGGKILIAVEDMTRLLAAGEIERPVVCMPGNLLREWCQEVAKFTRGQLRTFVINLKVWKRWTEDLKLNYGQIQELIAAQPPNTVLVTDFDFLTHGSEENSFDVYEYTFYPKANLFANLGIDYCVWDECFPGGTHVLVDYDKSVPIEEVYANPQITHVLSYDLEKRKIERKRIKNRFRTPFRTTDSWVTIKIYDPESGNFANLRCTPNHQIFLKDGSEVSAKDLKSGDKLITYGGDYKKHRVSPDGAIVECGRKYTSHIHTLNPPTLKVTKCPKCEFRGNAPEMMNHRISKHGDFAEFAKRRIELGRELLCKNLNPEDISRRMKLNNPMRKAKTRRKVAESRRKAFWSMPKEKRDAQTKRFMDAPKYKSGPNKVEQLIIDQNISGLHFRGDGSYFLKVNMDGVWRNKNPDFIYAPRKCGTCEYFQQCREFVKSTEDSCDAYDLSSTFRTSKVVEIMDFEYWHDTNEVAPLVDAYAERGVKCLVLDAKMPLAQKRAKIESHINNHYIEVVSVTKTAVSGDSFKFDIEVEGNHNYFVLAGTSKRPSEHRSGGVTIPVLVHNSQKIKNRNSQRTRAAMSAFGLARYKRIASGTIISKGVEDYTGQMAVINPAALGNDLAGLFDDKDFSLDNILELNRTIDAYARRIMIKRREWAFLLPRTKEQAHSVELTANQRRFYNQIMGETLEEMNKDEKLMEVLKEADPNDEGFVEEAFRRYFAKVEIFINAPDANINSSQYGFLFRNLPGISPDDLISPKVREIDRIINLHLNGGHVEQMTVEGRMVRLQVDPDPNKIIIVGYNREVSRHVYQHSSYAPLMVRYTSGDIAALDRFRNDPEIKILMADEVGITEGYNFQVCSRLIRTQVRWTAGEQEQMKSRIERPDVPDAQGRTRFIRDSINLDTIITDQTLEVAKQGRMIYRCIEKAKLEEADASASFRQMLADNAQLFAGLGKLSMSLVSVQEYSSFNDLTDYYQAYALYRQWEDSEFEISRQTLREMVSQRLGREISDGELASLAMVRVQNQPLVSAEAGGYTPWLEGITPFDKWNLRLKPLSDLNEEEPVENPEVRVLPGDLVLTEYGPGYLTTLRRGSSFARVQVPGFAKVPLRIPRTLLYIPTHPTRAPALAQMLKAASSRGMPCIRLRQDRFINDPNNIPLDQLDRLAAKMSQPPPIKVGNQPLSVPTAPNLQPMERPEPQAKRAVPYEMHPTTINNFLAIYAYAGGGLDNIFIVDGWSRIGKSLVAQVNNARGLANLIELLKSNFVVPSNNLRLLEAAVPILKDSKGRFSAIPPKNLTFLNSFWLENNRKPQVPEEIHPFFVIDAGNGYLYVNIETCPAARSLTRLPRVPGAGKFQEVEAFFLKLVSTKEDIADALARLEKRGIVVENPRAFERGLRAI